MYGGRPEAGETAASSYAASTANSSAATLLQTPSRANSALADDFVRVLKVNVTGSGSGTVTGVAQLVAENRGYRSRILDCTAVCEWLLETGSFAEATLTAAPDACPVFGGWSGGGCAGIEDAICRTSVTGAESITARFIER